MFAGMWEGKLHSIAPIKLVSIWTPKIWFNFASHAMFVSDFSTVLWKVNNIWVMLFAVWNIHVSLFVMDGLRTLVHYFVQAML